MSSVPDTVSAGAARADLLARLGALKGTKLYDLAAAMPVIAWTVLCAEHQVPALLHSLAAADLKSADTLFFARTASKSASILFLGVILVLLAIRRTPQGKARGLFPRIAAIAGTYLGVALLLLPEREFGWAPHFASALLVLGGTAFALYAIGTLGRSLSLMPEARSLVTAGPYAKIRHPLYLGEAVMLSGIALQYISLTALLLMALQFAFQVQRMKHEERVLAAAFPEYGAYRARTARLVPGLY
jgi:protein-S-isoprenylcysteine O-methyltransferase Ste14